MKLETLLEVEIQEEFGGLSTMEKGTEQHKAAVNGLTQLIDRSIEIAKMEADYEMKRKQAEEDRKDRLVKNVLTGAGIVIPAVLTVWGTVVSLKFEQEGTVTTTIGRGFINKLLPKK